MCRDCCVALPRGAMGVSAVCDCGISRSYSFTIFTLTFKFRINLQCYEEKKSNNSITPSFKVFSIL